MDSQAEKKFAAARQMVRLGFKVFKLAPNSKKPEADSAGFKDAITNLAQIKQWFEDDPKINYGVAVGEKHVVIDLDEKTPPKSGLASFRQYFGKEFDEFMLQSTLVVRTPTNGYHVYFQVAEPQGDRISWLPCVDVRAAGGYVVGPESTIDGKPYVVETAAEIADEIAWLPGKIESELGHLRQRSEKADVPIYPWNSEGAIERGIEYLRTRKPAIEGQGGDNHTYVTVLQLRDYCLDRDKALELMTEYVDPHLGTTWNDRCVPPWNIAEIGIKATNAYNYAKERPGSKGGMSDTDEGIAELLKDVEDSDAVIEKVKKANEGKSMFDRMVSVGDFMSQQLDYRFIIPRWLPAQGYTAVLAPLKVGKTTFLVDMLMHIACDMPTWHSAEIDSGWNVIYVVAEDVEGLHQRLHAWTNTYGRMPDVGRFVVLDLPIDVLDIDSQREFVGAYVKKFEEQFKTKKTIVALDTWARMSMSAESQNSDKDMPRAAKNVEDMVKHLGGCAIIAFHPPKNNPDTIKGAGELQNMSNCIIKMKMVDKEREVWVDRLKGGEDGATFKFVFKGVEIPGEDFRGKKNEGPVLQEIFKTDQVQKNKAYAVGEWLLAVMKNCRRDPESNLKPDMTVPKLTEFALTFNENPKFKDLLDQALAAGLPIDRPSADRVQRHPLYGILKEYHKTGIELRDGSRLEAVGPNSGFVHKEDMMAKQEIQASGEMDGDEVYQEEGLDL